MPAYDHPFYKKLAKNEVGTNSHQGGPALPISLRKYFPPLPPPTTGPTEEYFIKLDLFDGPTPVGSVTSRWHYQTWDKKRPPETRLTQNIGPLLLKSASPGDYLIFQRELGHIDRYRVTLVRSGTSAHRRIQPVNPQKAWGPVGEQPNSLARLQSELADIQRLSAGPFELFQSPRAVIVGRRFLRDAAFSRLVKKAYDHKCALCDQGLVVPADDVEHDPPSEPEAAHIVPASLNGADDVRNGLCLCRTHHWAFDRGLIFVNESLRWSIPEKVRREPRNDSLHEEGLHLTLPTDPALHPAEEALAWHRQNVAFR